MLLDPRHHDCLMAKQYLERLDALLAPVARDLPPQAALEIKHFFSGAPAYTKGP